MARRLLHIYRVALPEVKVKTMCSNARVGSMIISLAIGGILSGCYSSTKEVDTVPAPATVMQVPPPVVQVPAAVVQVPAPVIVAPASEASQTTTSTSWGNGAVEQKRTTTSVDGQVQNQTTTTTTTSP
jgi:hypothetical protein